MKSFYTLLGIQAYETLQRKGRVCCDFTPYSEEEPHIERPYQFMANAMVEKGYSRPLDAVAPIWLWERYDGKQDVPQYLFDNMEPGVLLKLSIKKDRVLLSDFDLWSIVMLNGYLPGKGEELPEQPKQNCIETSWKRVFTPSEVSLGYLMPAGKRTVQGCVWEIHVADIQACLHHFDGKRKLA